MLIKHKNGQVIDYSMIVHLLPYGDVEAVKSSEHKTEYSGNIPAELFIEVKEGEFLRTTDFLAVHDNFLTEFTILDRNVIDRITDIIQEKGVSIEEMGTVTLLHDSTSSDKWTIVSFYKGISFNPFIDDDAVCIDVLSVFWLPYVASK